MLQASTIETLARHGFVHDQTGGGCTAYRRDIGDGAYELITAHEDASAPESESELCTVGSYQDAEDEGTYEHASLRRIIDLLNDDRNEYALLGLRIANAGRGTQTGFVDELATARTVVRTTNGLPLEGQRVQLKVDVDRYNHFVAPKFATGTVTEVHDSQIAVKMDLVIEGAEEWNNCVIWQDEDVAHFWTECEGIGHFGDDRHVDALVTAAMDAAALTIQKALGVTTGDRAALLLSDGAAEAEFRAYARAEIEAAVVAMA